MIYDFSQTGVRLTLAGDFKLPQEFHLDMTHNASVVRHCKLAWQDGFTAGAQFVKTKQARA